MRRKDTDQVKLNSILVTFLENFLQNEVQSYKTTKVSDENITQLASKRILLIVVLRPHLPMARPGHFFPVGLSSPCIKPRPWDHQNECAWEERHSVPQLLLLLPRSTCSPVRRESRSFQKLIGRDSRVPWVNLSPRIRT